MRGCVRAVAGSVDAAGSAYVRVWRDGGTGGSGGDGGGRTRRHVRGDGVELSLRSIMGAARAARCRGIRCGVARGGLPAPPRPRGDVRRRGGHRRTASRRRSRIGTPNGPICGVPHRPAGIRRRSGDGSGNQPATQPSTSHPAIRPSGHPAIQPRFSRSTGMLACMSRAKAEVEERFRHPETTFAKYRNARTQVANKV